MRYMALHELRLCGKYKSEVSQVLKESSASSALKTEKKPLMLQVCVLLFSMCMCLEFLKLPLAHLQNLFFLVH